MRRIICLTALALGLYLASGPAGHAARAEPAGGKGDAAAKSKRIAYVVKYGSAKNLAALVRRHFKEEAEVEAAPDPASNCLLIRTAPATHAAGGTREEGPAGPRRQ
jgi:hypothetical protein